MIGDSFQFGRYNSLDDWGIKCVAHDFLLPQKRARKVVIPGRSGTYNYGSTLYEERTLVIECVLTKKISKSELREIAYLLSEKKKLTIWNEPDKYYMAEIYDLAEVTDLPKETMRTFELTFICEPFAYREKVDLNIKTGVNAIKYDGTAETPCLIILKNNNSFPVSNITITAVKRRK